MIAPGLEIVSDASWQCALYEAYQNTEAPFPNYRMPESNIRFDARQAITNWNRTSFEGSLPGAVCVGKAGESSFRGSGGTSDTPVEKQRPVILCIRPGILERRYLVLSFAL